MLRNLAALAAATVQVAPLSAISVEQANTAFGISLLADENLWDDEAAAVAKRLGWPVESVTSNDASFRKYPGEQDRILGARPHSTVLHAEDGKPSSLSLVFANKGDAVLYTTPESNREAKRLKNEQVREIKRTIQEDKRQLEENLEGLFGEPKADRFGQGRETRENVKRWDWNGHAFLLAAPRDEYVALRIMPLESADAGGKSRVPDSEIRKRVAARVERRPNGDVILKDMPMVNQGPKGYCVPATWERVMRYMGVPADMYVLAMAGDTGMGGGTSVDAIATGARESIVRSGRKIENVSARPEPREVSKYIDRGLPLMWAMFSTGEFNHAANSRIGPRKQMGDPAEWRKSLADARKAAKKFRPERGSGHVCMIIGYNEQTGEVAVSDSWGPQFAERWVAAEEAAAVCQGRLQAIVF
ncbi:MAG: hypothetical protein KGR46_00255 [Verrucomicrobia bacterium]|nr:hypothetical protein [Verrucomicrobiota bacterium]